MIPIRVGDRSALIYLYRPTKLKLDISNETGAQMLREYGYDSTSPNRCIMELIRRFQMEQTATLISSLQNRRTVLIVTHDLELIVRCCTHILHLENGQCTENYALSEETMPLLQSFFGCSE